MGPTGPNPSPYDFAEARQALAAATRAQAQAEQFVRDAYRQLGEAEQSYRVALARKIVELHADGVAWSSTADLARGDDKVARLRYERDVAEGVLEAAKQAGWRHQADRRATQSLVDWSAKVRPFGEQREPEAALA